MKYRLLIFLTLLFSLRAYSQCTLSVSLSQSAPSICSGYTVTLTATASSGTAPYSYIWSTGQTSSSIVVDKGGTYSVSVTDKTPGCQPVKKSLTITAAATPDAPTAANAVVCPNTSATLTATAPGGTYQWYNASTGGTFLATGATYNTPPITTGSTFYVQTTVAGCTSTRTAVFVGLTQPPTVSDTSTCSGTTVTLTASGGTNYTWYNTATSQTVLATGASFTTPVLTYTKSYFVSSVAPSGCLSARTGVTITVTPVPQAPTAANATCCSGSTVNLQASSSTGIISWYSAPSGGLPLISSPDYTTPALTTTTTYYVSSALNGCESVRTPVMVTVIPPPAAPAAQSDTTCYQSKITLTAGAAAAGTYQWFSTPGGSVIATGPTFTTPVLTNSTAYYVQLSNGSCISPQTQINVIVSAVPPAPSAADAIVCLGTSATLTATSQGAGTFAWYNQATGGTLLATGASYITPVLVANETYYVQNIISGCVSPRTAVTVTVLSTIAPPTASGATICSGNTAELSASGSAGGYAWYSSITGGTLLATTQTYVTPVLSSGASYYVSATVNGCESKRVGVTVLVNPTPAAPTANGATICIHTSAMLTASAATGNIKWYSDTTGGPVLASGNNYTTPVLTANTTYYVTATAGECTSAFTAVPVTINTLYDRQFHYNSGTFCAAGANETPVIENTAGGTFSSSPTGLVFVSTTTGEINIAASTPGFYLITFAGNGSCAGIDSARIDIATNPNATFSYAGPYCQGTIAYPTPTFPAGSSGGIFTGSSPGLIFVDSSTGEINLATSTPGTYTVTNYIAASGSCPASTATNTITLSAPVLISAGPSQTAATGSAVQLAGTVSGGASGGTWSGGGGTFNNPSLLNAVYTPAAGETKVTLTLTSTAPAAPCGPVSAQMTITYGPATPAPTVPSATACSGSSATLSATAPGGTYQWYDAATAGNLLQTGPNYTTPALTVNTTYYVQSTLNGITSSRTAVTVSVNPATAPPVAAGAQVCTGTSTTLTATAVAGVAYAWYDAPTGGNLLSTTNTYATPDLIANTSYYVQSEVNGCTSVRTEVDVTVTPVPTVTSAATGVICSGQSVDYTITASVTGTTFNWSRAAVAGISNPAETNQTSSTISDILMNTGTTAVNVTYVITPSAGSCPGPAFNYVLTVNPSPVLTSPAAATICDMTSDNYTATFNIPITNYTWSRAAVPGISNLAVSGQGSSVIQEVLFDTLSTPVAATYILNYSNATCSGTAIFVVTVNPQALVTSAAKGSACTGAPQDYVITSNLAGATFSWSRAAVASISNAAVTNQTSGTISESLINTGTVPVNVEYDITPIVNGCPGTLFKYVVSVSTALADPVATGNSPVCTGSNINLSTPPQPNATYLWTGPNGYTSTDQNPSIDNVTTANAGVYTLVYTEDGCNSNPVSVNVVVDEPPMANAGPNQLSCIAAPSVFLMGSISGGTTSGIWTTSGTGTFSPSGNDLTVEYIPSAADKAGDSVILTLTSTSKDNCTPAVSTMTITFGTVQAVHAGLNQTVCSQNTSVQLAGTISIAGGATWKTAGSGTFSPAATDLNASYLPSAADEANGSVKLFLYANTPGPCYTPSDSLKITFLPPPVVSAGGTRYVLKGSTITLYSKSSEQDVHYLWSPNTDINNDTLKNPVITGGTVSTYTLTVTDSLGCVGQDTALIIVTPELSVNNTFTPNGDGINDVWDIPGLIAYPDATVDVFDRYGQKVFHSISYPKAWDGTYNGKQVPNGVYYYIINTHFTGPGQQQLTGWVTVLR